MSRVVFVKGQQKRGWAVDWAMCDHCRIVVDSDDLSRCLNRQFMDDFRSLAAACAANALTNAARKGWDVAVVEDVPSIERRLRHIAKRERMEIVEHEI